MQSTEPIMQFFDFGHLPPSLQVVSARFHDLAWTIHETTDRSPERSMCLRKLLEAKDAGVRAVMLTGAIHAEATTERPSGGSYPKGDYEGQAGKVPARQEADGSGTGEGE